MTEQFEPGPFAPGHDDGHTGVAAVDEVVAMVDAVDQRDLADHVEVFTQAHERLRGVLDAPDESA